MPGRQWFAGEAGAPVSRVAAYRFDDPAGEVGIETLLVAPVTARCSRCR
ncbi:hypothetical protein V2I01_28660 [Micromonospora sp. BRA006-A]|nr:hypothetical protein [Micromonospora sp. BRA006-A]